MCCYISILWQDKILSLKTMAQTMLTLKIAILNRRVEFSFAAPICRKKNKNGASGTVDSYK